jgi:hypothetical protein
MSLERNQQGFSPWIILLIILVLAILGFVGWRAWIAEESASDIPHTSDTGSESETPEEPAEPEPTYALPPSKAYRVAQPNEWVTRTCPDSPDLLFLAPSSDKLGTCNSENGGTVAISKNGGNLSQPESYYTSNAEYSGVSYTAFSADGISGYKVSYTIAAENILGYPPVGTQQTQYLLFDGTSSFTIVYTRLPGHADVSTAVQALAESFDKL